MAQEKSKIIECDRSPLKFLEFQNSLSTVENSKEIAGYYCTSASSIEFANIPDSLNKKLPKYPAPVMLVGQLAVDKKMQGKGLGKVLLMHALSRGVHITELPAKKNNESLHKRIVVAIF